MVLLESEELFRSSLSRTLHFSLWIAAVLLALEAVEASSVAARKNETKTLIREQSWPHYLPHLAELPQVYNK